MSYTDAKTTLNKQFQFTAPEIFLQLDSCEHVFENPKCQQHVLAGEATEHEAVYQRVTRPIQSHSQTQNMEGNQQVSQAGGKAKVIFILPVKSWKHFADLTIFYDQTAHYIGMHKLIPG